MMLTGMLLRRFGVLDSATAIKLNRIVFYVGVPALCFCTVMNSDFSDLGDASVLLLCAGGIVVAFTLLCLLVPRFCASNPRRGALVQAMFRPNEAIFGIPIAMALYGDSNLALLSLGVVLSVLLNNFFGVLGLELFHDEKQSVWTMLRQLASNPILIASVAAILLRLLGWQLPELLFAPIRSFSAMCSPLAFLALGASLSLGAIQEDRVAIAAAVIVKLLVLPAVMLALAILLGFRGLPLTVVLVLFAPPTAVSSFALASALGADARLAGEIVAVASVASIVTLFLFVFTLKQLGVV